jgi:hypothetical protein
MVTLSNTVVEVMLVTADEVWAGITAWTTNAVCEFVAVGGTTSTTRQCHTARRTAENPSAVSV